MSELLIIGLVACGTLIIGLGAAAFKLVAAPVGRGVWLRGAG